MSIIYSPKQVAPETQDLIAQFLATNSVSRPLRKGEALKIRKAEKAAAAREAELAKREREHTKLVDARG